MKPLTTVCLGDCLYLVPHRKCALLLLVFLPGVRFSNIFSEILHQRYAAVLLIIDVLFIMVQIVVNWMVLERKRQPYGSFEHCKPLALDIFVAYDMKNEDLEIF